MNKSSIAVFLAYAALVAFVSLAPGGSSVIGPYDKVAHFITYGLFSTLAHRINLPRRQFLYVCIGIVAYSGLLEVGQSFVPGRDMSAPDLLANALGVVLGALLSKKIFTAKKPPSS